MTETLQWIFQYICQHSDQAHWILCGLILLAGLYIPISEDFLLLSAGAIASACFTKGTFYMYGLVLVSCLLSGWEAYWIGRLLGTRLLQFQWFSYLLPPTRIEAIAGFYKKYGIYTFIVGRFIPGGVRNALFFSSGLTKMPFQLFMVRDFVGCFLACTTLFYLGHLFGSNSHIIFHYLHIYEQFFLCFFALMVILGIVWIKMRTLKPQLERRE